MSQALGTLDLTFKAGEDLGAYQYYFVYLSADQTVSKCTTGHVIAIGVLQNNPEINEEALVRVIGTSKVKAGTPLAVAITAGVRVISNVSGAADGSAASNGTPQTLLGVALEGAVADDVFEIFLIQDTIETT